MCRVYANICGHLNSAASGSVRAIAVGRSSGMLPPLNCHPRDERKDDVGGLGSFWATFRSANDAAVRAAKCRRRNGRNASCSRKVTFTHRIPEATSRSGAEVGRSDRPIKGGHVARPYRKSRLHLSNEICGKLAPSQGIPQRQLMFASGNLKTWPVTSEVDHPVLEVLRYGCCRFRPEPCPSNRWA